MKSNPYLALEEFSKIDSMDETIADINLILEGFTHVIQSIYDEKPTLGEGEVLRKPYQLKSY